MASMRLLLVLALGGCTGIVSPGQDGLPDQRLAAHYGLTWSPTHDPSSMQRVDTTSVQRAGLLTLGGVLTATAFPTRTSPVKRGQLVLNQLLCTSVPAPPPDVIGLEEGQTGSTTGLTLRQRLEAHRDKPTCRACHAVIPSAPQWRSAGP